MIIAGGEGNKDRLLKGMDGILGGGDENVLSEYSINHQIVHF